ncbi:UNVERIFIED_ORG: subtilisin family serine protease [Arthrobacter sp. UYCu721]
MLQTPRALLVKATTAAVVAILATGGVASIPAPADAVGLPAQTWPALPAAATGPTDQFIVALKQKAGPASAAAGQAVAEAARRLGVPAREVRATSTGARVLKTDRVLPAAEAATFLAALRANPDVEYAEPDTIMHRAATEPDNGGYPLQWGLWEEAGGIRAPGAWEVNRGQGVVVAVVDTGITSHMDLDANVLPGYDMISDPANARDGGGRDANPRDEGDWASADECGAGTVVGPSSWHGTHVAGTIAAVADNGNHVMSGVAPKAKILPLRALGPCGGYSSDVTDSIIWAAGGSVPGAPVNPNPARVINLSLGGVVQCSTTYQQAINFANGAGAAVVVAAGNINRPAADLSPANCPNVIAVAASTRQGARAPYSNYGSAIDVAAPGGYMTAGSSDGILSTYNDGMTTPEGGGYAYLQGTSMAAPHVSGVTALLMAQMGPAYTPAAAEQRLKDTARPLPAGCTGGCGAGLIDATAAINFVVEPDPNAVPGVFRSAAPFRALDTRSGSPVAGDGLVSFQVAGVNDVPASATAVVFNLTVADAKSFGFVTAYATGTLRPNASNVNFSAGQIVANAVTVPLGADGKVSLFNRSSGAAHMLADVSGYFVPTAALTAGAFQAVAPQRFLDTRTSVPVGPDSSVSFRVAGLKGIPSNVSAVVFNLTVAEAASFGFVTAYPSGTARPNASSVNFSGSQIVPNSVTVPVGADGKVTLFNRSAGATHLLADVSGYYLPGTPTVAGTFRPVAPNRFLDTRSTAGVLADTSVSFQVAAVNGIPAAVSAVVFNMTVADAQSFGFATAHASGTPRPNASNVNFSAGQIVPNSVTVPVGADGKAALFNRSAGVTHFLADVSGYYLR